jgi:hypothetical protein
MVIAFYGYICIVRRELYHPRKGWHLVGNLDNVITCIFYNLFSV